MGFGLISSGLGALGDIFGGIGDGGFGAGERLQPEFASLQANLQPGERDLKSPMQLALMSQMFQSLMNPQIGMALNNIMSGKAFNAPVPMSFQQGNPYSQPVSPPTYGTTNTFGMPGSLGGIMPAFEAGGQFGGGGASGSYGGGQPPQAMQGGGEISPEMQQAYFNVHGKYPEWASNKIQPYMGQQQGQQAGRMSFHPANPLLNTIPGMPVNRGTRLAQNFNTPHGVLATKAAQLSQALRGVG